jgi:hypothetical protein
LKAKDVYGSFLSLKVGLFSICSLGYSRTETIIIEATKWPFIPAPIGVIGEILGRGYRSTCRKRVRMWLCPPQIPHDLTPARPRAAAVGSWRLTAWAPARYSRLVTLTSFVFFMWEMWREQSVSLNTKRWRCRSRSKAPGISKLATYRLYQCLDYILSMTGWLMTIAQ